jgi:hypothetical protein
MNRGLSLQAGDCSLNRGLSPYAGGCSHNGGLSIQTGASPRICKRNPHLIGGRRFYEYIKRAATLPDGDDAFPLNAADVGVFEFRSTVVILRTAPSKE